MVSSVHSSTHSTESYKGRAAVVVRDTYGNIRYLGGDAVTFSVAASYGMAKARSVSVNGSTVLQETCGMSRRMIIETGTTVSRITCPSHQSFRRYACLLFAVEVLASVMHSRLTCA